MFDILDYDSYFLWLCGLVDADMSRYSELLFKLFDTDFVWILELDENRAIEGLDLRKEFLSLHPEEDWIMFLEKDCSVLEMLIALAQRMEGVLGDIETGDRTRVWFWEMIRNLGLKLYSNIRLESDLLSENDLIDIQMILSNWMNREFEPDGTGSIYPIDIPKHNQKELTIVYQMYDYIFDKHPV